MTPRSIGLGLGLLALVALPPGDLGAAISAQSSPNSLEIRGANAMLPVMQLVVEGFMRDHPESTIALTGGGADRGLKALLVGVSEVAVATEDVEEELKQLATARKLKLSACHGLYTDALVPVVDPKNTISDLRREQLRAVFSGRIKNWSELGGGDAPIEVVSHAATSGTFLTFKGRVLGPDAVIAPSAKVLSSLADFDKSIGENAIGYVDLARVGGLKSLKVDGVAASTETITNETYPIRRLNCLYTLEPASALARQFIDYARAEDKGLAIVRSRGLVVNTKVVGP